MKLKMSRKRMGQKSNKGDVVYFIRKPLDTVSHIEFKFAAMLLKGRLDLDDPEFVRQSLENVVGEIREYVLNNSLEDEVLLKLFTILDAATDKLAEINNT